MQNDSFDIARWATDDPGGRRQGERRLPRGHGDRHARMMIIALATVMMCSATLAAAARAQSPPKAILGQPPHKVPATTLQSGKFVPSAQERDLLIISKQDTLPFAPLNPANNLSDLSSPTQGGLSLPRITAAQIPSFVTPQGCFWTTGYSTPGDGGQALYCRDPSGYARYVSTFSDGVTIKGSALIASGSTTNPNAPPAYFNVLDSGRPIYGSGIPAATTIVGPAHELSGPPPVAAGGSGYRWARFKASMASGVLTVTHVYAGTLAVGQRVYLPSANCWPYATITSLGAGAGGAGTYNTSCSGGAASANDGWSGDTITLNDGCDVHGVLVVRLTTPSGQVLATPLVGTPSECASVPSNPIGQLSTSGAGSGAAFNATFWPSATYAYMSAAAAASATGVSVTLGATPVDDPGYVVDSAGNGVALASQALDPRMFGAIPDAPLGRGGDSCAALQQYFAAVSNTRFPMAKWTASYDSHCQQQIALPRLDFGWEGSNDNRVGINFSVVRQSPLLLISLPGGTHPNGDKFHSGFGEIVAHLHFAGTAIGGATVQLGTRDNRDAWNNPTFVINASNSSIDPFAEVVFINDIFGCGIGQCNLYATGGPGSNYTSDGSTTGTNQFCSGSATFSFADIGQEISTERTTGGGTVPVGAFITDAPPDTTAGCVILSQTTTGSASNLNWTKSALLADVHVQGGNFVNYGGTGGGGAAASWLLTSYFNTGTRNSVFMGINTESQNIAGFRFADTLVHQNDVFGGMLGSNYGIDAVAGYGNQAWGVSMQQNGACPNCEILFGNQNGIVSYESDRTTSGPGTNVFTGPISASMHGYAISGLPTCTSASAGLFAYVTNGQTSPPYLGAVGTTGSTVAPVFCNGSSWIYH